jgi:trans-aconitate 2-methyltransferase
LTSRDFEEGGTVSVAKQEEAVAEATFMTWDPAQYERFAGERARPFRDLLGTVDVAWASSVVDLGCGPGTLTAELARRWPAARVVGVDNSKHMLTRASALAVPGRLEFVQADLRTYEPDGPVDVLVTNATLHWVPGHLELLGRLASYLSPGGVLALQVPGNFGEPSHVLLRELAASDRWCPLLEEGRVVWPSSHDPATYLQALRSAGLAAFAWETTYLQLLSGEDAVLEWMKGTSLRPVMEALDPLQADSFTAEYRTALRAAYPPQPSGTLLPFRRVFAVGRRADDDRTREMTPTAGPTAGPTATSTAPPAMAVRKATRAVVCALDHAQLAIPVGGEHAGRSFYCGLLGLVEQTKPLALAARGGCWFRGFGTEVHLGVDPQFRAAKKAHVGLAVEGLDALAARLEAGGCTVQWDDELAPRRRFYTEDPFGNRIELLEPAL